MRWRQNICLRRKMLRWWWWSIMSMLPSLFCVFCPMTQSAGLQKMKSFSGRLVSSLHSAQPGCQQGAAALISPGPAADTASRYTRLLILISDVLLLKIWGSYHLRVLSIVAISTSDMFCASLYITAKVWSHISMVYISPAVRWRRWPVSSQGKLQPGPRLQARFSHFFADERAGEELSSVVALRSLHTLGLETKVKQRFAKISPTWRRPRLGPSPGWERLLRLLSHFTVG